MCRAWHNREAYRCNHPPHRLFVELDDYFNPGADDEQCRRLNPWQLLVCQIRPAASGDHRCDPVRSARRSNERGTASGAGTKQPDWKVAGFGLGLEPTNCANETLGQQSDVESEVSGSRIEALLVGGKEIH